MRSVELQNQPVAACLDQLVAIAALPKIGIRTVRRGLRRPP